MRTSAAAIRSMPLSVLNSKLGTLSSLSTTNKTSAVAAINEVYDRTNNDVLLYNASALSHTFTVPNSSRHLALFTGDGISRYWFGFIYSGTGGAISLAEISKGSNISVVSSANNKVTVTFDSANSCFARSFNVRGNAITV